MEELGNEIKALEEIVVGEAEKVENGGNQKIQEREDGSFPVKKFFIIKMNFCVLQNPWRLKWTMK